MKPFDYLAPPTLTAAIECLVKCGPQGKILAGGTDLLVEMKEGIAAPQYVIHLKNVPGLNTIQLEAHHLKIGALVSVHDIETHPLIQEKVAILAQAASVLGSWQIRNKGTIGGNLCRASPSADLAPPLVVLGARAKIVGKTGERLEDLETLFTGPGKTTLRIDEILTEIQIPLPPTGSAGVYLKFSTRRAMDLAVVGVAAMIQVDVSSQICTWARIGLGAVAPTPLRAKSAEKKLTGQRIEAPLVEEAADLAAEESSPISDIRGSAWYRKEVIKILVKRGIGQALERIYTQTKEALL